MQKEYIYDALKETAKKIDDLREFHVAVIIKTIEEYEKAGVGEFFLEQQKSQLHKVYARIAELEDKGRRLLERLK